MAATEAQTEARTLAMMEPPFRHTVPLLHFGRSYHDTSDDNSIRNTFLSSEVWLSRVAEFLH